MRVKQTAKKITNENSDNIHSSDTSNDVENIEQSSCDNQNDNSDNEVEILVECRRDQEGNQFLLDGTLVIEPAPVDNSNEYKENQDSSKEIDFDQFIKEIGNTIPNDKKIKQHVLPKRSISSFGPDLSIYNSVKCTACGNKFSPVISETLFKHPLMEVILCSDCIQNQKDEFFVIDKEDNKETLCRWCVEGGSLICCDFCPKSFCKICIKRNLGSSTLKEILNQDDSVQWRCFACDPKPIEHLKVECRKVFSDAREYAENQRSDKSLKKLAPKLSEIVSKKRSITKAFPNETTNGSPHVSASKITTPQSTGKTAQNTTVLLNNMANFGTEWYMRNVKLRNIFTEIDEIDSRTLLNAINSTKKCVEAFYSDIRNLEVEISKASTASDIPAIVSMFKSVYRHHIFNRFCQVRTRIEEDKRVKFVGVPAGVGVPVSVAGGGGLMMNGGCGAGAAAINPGQGLVINNVVSTAPGSVRLGPLVAMQAAVTNGHRHSSVMASIDLTDEPDKPESPPPAIIDNEVVDLCMDDDSVPAYVTLHSTDPSTTAISIPVTVDGVPSRPVL